MGLAANFAVTAFSPINIPNMWQCVKENKRPMTSQHSL